MTTRENITRIAKILARATSPEPNEAATAVDAAYKRMRRDQVGVKHLLSLPLIELYQEALVKLVMRILSQQQDLSPGERRKAFENYMSLISARFAAGEEVEDVESREHERQRQEDQNRARATADAIRSAHEKARREAEEQEVRSRRDLEEAAQNVRARASAVAEPDRSGYIPVLLVAAIVVAIALKLATSKPEFIEPATISQPPLSVPISQPEHAVAAPNVNLRAAPDAKSKILLTIGRGEVVRLLSEQSGFAQVEVPGGYKGFISRELLISVADARRLSSTSGRDYVSQRMPEKRIDVLIAQTEKQSAAFVTAVMGISDQSAHLDKYLTDIEASKAVDIQVDVPAATWFGFAARHSMTDGRLDDAYWESRAAVEAAPGNPEFLVALGLASYKSGNLETLMGVATLLPRLAPRSTNSWMIFALAETLKERPDDDLAKYALVLAMRLSKKSQTTQRYFAEMAKTAGHEKTRQVFSDALEEERRRPDLFAPVSAPRLDVSSGQRELGINVLASLEQKNQLSPFEHRAFAREAAGENTLVASLIAVGTFAYQPYKMIIGQSGSRASLDQKGQGLMGVGGGCGTRSKTPLQIRDATGSYGPSRQSCNWREAYSS